MDTDFYADDLGSGSEGEEGKNPKGPTLHTGGDGMHRAASQFLDSPENLLLPVTYQIEHAKWISSGVSLYRFQTAGFTFVSVLYLLLVLSAAYVDILTPIESPAEPVKDASVGGGPAGGPNGIIGASSNNAGLPPSRSPEPFRGGMPRGAVMMPSGGPRFENRNSPASGFGPGPSAGSTAVSGEDDSNNWFASHVNRHRLTTNNLLARIVVSLLLQWLAFWLLAAVVHVAFDLMRPDSYYAAPPPPGGVAPQFTTKDFLRKLARGLSAVLLPAGKVFLLIFTFMTMQKLILLTLGSFFAVNSPTVYLVLCVSFVITALGFEVGTLFVLPLLVDHPSLPAVFTVITSFRVVERNIPGICCLVLVLYAVRVAGLVCCVVGYFPAVVVSHIVVACAYKDLMGVASHSRPSADEEEETAKKWAATAAAAAAADSELEAGQRAEGVPAAGAGGNSKG